MKNVALSICLMTLFALTTGYAEEMTIRVNESDYPPFFIKSENRKWSGLSIELVESLLHEAGFTVNYKPLPFARGLQYIQYGEIDAMLNMSITDERKKFIYFIGPQLDETVLLVVKKDSNFKITSIDDLKKLPENIGIDRGRVYGQAFEEKRAIDEELRNRLEEVTDTNINEKKLEADRISGFLGYEYNILYQMKINPLYKDFSVHPFVVNQDWVYYGFSKKSVSPGHLKKIQEAYDRAKAKGIFEAIKKKYKYSRIHSYNVSITRRY